MKDIAADSRDHLDRALFVAVSVVDVRVVYVTMCQRFVIVEVRMRVTRGVFGPVGMLVVGVVGVRMTV